MSKIIEMSEIIVRQEARSPAPIPPLADCTPEKQIELRYVAAANALYDDAVENQSAKTLAKVLTWTLAKIAVEHGSQWVAGDIVRRLGDFICILTEHRYAENEAEKAKQEGRKPN